MIDFPLLFFYNYDMFHETSGSVWNYEFFELYKCFPCLSIPVGWKNGKVILDDPGIVFGLIKGMESEYEKYMLHTSDSSSV